MASDLFLSQLSTFDDYSDEDDEQVVPVIPCAREIFFDSSDEEEEEDFDASVQRSYSSQSAKVIRGVVIEDKKAPSKFHTFSEPSRSASTNQSSCSTTEQNLQEASTTPRDPDAMVNFDVHDTLDSFRIRRPKKRKATKQLEHRHSKKLANKNLVPTNIAAVRGFHS